MRTPAIPVLFVLTCLTAGCQHDAATWSEPRTVSAAQRPTEWGAPAKDRLALQDMRGTAAPQGQQPVAQFVGQAPAAWEELPGQPARFRDRLWRIRGDEQTECYLTNAVGGGVAGNLARWYGQLGQPQTGGADSLPAVEFAGRSGRLLELSGSYQGKPDYAMMVAFVAQGDMVTTLKFIGPKATVTDHRADFLALAKALQPATGGAPAPANPMPDGDAGGKQFVGQAPAGWQEQDPQPARFRDRVWRFGGDTESECYLTNAVGGGLAGNVVRWYGQFGAQPAAVESLPVIEFAGRPGRLLELTGTYQGKPDYGMLVAFAAQGDMVTTLKLIGPQGAVLTHKDEFLELAKALRAASTSPMPTAPPIERGQPMPSGHPPVDAGAEHDAPPAPFAATVPAGWTPKAGSQRVLHHTFGDGGEVYVSMLGGSMRAMLDIWRGEIAGLGQISDADFAAVPKVPMLGGQASLVDAAGDYTNMGGTKIPNGRLLVAAIEQDGGIVFAKMFGKAADVEAQRAAFLQFCASLRRQP